jgi:hypothetical protein
MVSQNLQGKYFADSLRTLRLKNNNLKNDNLNAPDMKKIKK